MSEETRQGYLPCSVCGRFGSEGWTDESGTTWLVTAPRGVTVEEGEEWTCKWCVRQGHKQRATDRSSEKESALI